MRNSQSENYQIIVQKKRQKDSLYKGMISGGLIVLVMGLLLCCKVEKNYFEDKIIWNDGSVSLENTGMIDTSTRFEESLSEEETKEFNRLLYNYRSKSEGFIKGQVIDTLKPQVKIYQLINNGFFNFVELSITISSEELEGISLGCLTFDFNIASSVNKESSFVNNHPLILTKGYTKTGNDIYYQAKFNYQDWWYIITSNDEEKTLSVVKSILEN